VQKTTLKVNLMAMPAGTVTIGTTVSAQKSVYLNVFGLTPGSAHTVLLHGNAIGTLTADGTGQASATFTVNSIPGGSRVKILDGGQGTNVIARTNPLSGDGQYQLHALEPGFQQGSLQGHAILVYDPAAQTITVARVLSYLSADLRS
jgi:hypothetical protein